MKRLFSVWLLLCLMTVAAFAQGNRVLPKDSDIKVRTDTAIPA